MEEERVGIRSVMVLATSSLSHLNLITISISADAVMAVRIGGVGGGGGRRAVGKRKNMNAVNYI